MSRAANLAIFAANPPTVNSTMALFASNVGINNTAPSDMLSVNGSVQFTNTSASVFYAAATGKVGIGVSSINSTYLQLGSAGQYSSSLAVRQSRNSIEWGHPNQGGYGSVLGAEEPSGHSFIAFNAGNGTNPNTYKTWGMNGFVIKNDLSVPALTFNYLATTSADNQSLTERMRIDSSGNMQVGGTTVTNTTGYVNSRTNTRAWARWAGTTGTITSSYNVSSVTRNSTGDYTVNYTTALADANYAVIGVTAGDTVYGGYGGYLQLKSAPTTSSCAITTRGNSGTYYDAPSVQIVVFGN